MYLCVIYLQARALKVSPQQTGGSGPVPSPPQKQKLPAVDAKSAQQTDEILNSILPPRLESQVKFYWRYYSIIHSWGDISFKFSLPLISRPKI